MQQIRREALCRRFPRSTGRVDVGTVVGACLCGFAAACIAWIC